MIIGTHNSMTGHKLIWWQRPFGWLINRLCRCQTKTVQEQLDKGVRWFNLQVNKYKGRWIGSHGIAWYDVDLVEVVKMLNDNSTVENPIYVQLALDNRFFSKKDVDGFKKFVNTLMDENRNLKYQYMRIEESDGSGEMLFYDPIPDNQEVYWTMTWAQSNSVPWYYKIPLPYKWSPRVENKTYISSSTQLVMYDFI